MALALGASVVCAAASSVEARSRGDTGRAVDVRRLSHVVNLLRRSLQIDLRSAEGFVADLQEWVVRGEGENRQGEDPTGSKTKRWARRLVRGLEQHPAVRDRLFREGGGVIEALEELEKRASRHFDRVAAIEKQHDANREGVDIDLDPYSVASAYMVESWWLRAVHARIVQWIDEYCLLTPEQLRRGHHPWAFKAGGLPEGWRLYKMGGREMFWNPDAKKMQAKMPEMMDLEVPPPREPPVPLLDIGSCSNPFSRFDFEVAPYALDLRPAEDAEGVLQADWFEVPIVDDLGSAEPPSGEADEDRWAPVEDRIRVRVSEDGERAEAVARGSFDVAVLSLVLSYVPDPLRRIEMVAKARQCLREDRGLLFVVEVGSALKDTSWHQGDTPAEWTRAIEAVGFRCLKFQDEVREKRPNRKHSVCQWIFETVPVPEDVELMPLLTPREMP